MDEQTTTMGVRHVDARVSIIDVAGEITAASEAVMMDAYNRASREQTRAVILNFTELDHMNSGGIGLLVTLLVRANRQRQKLMVFGLSDHYRRIFELTRLNEAIGIYADEPSALAAVRAGV